MHDHESNSLVTVRNVNTGQFGAHRLIISATRKEVHRRTVDTRQGKLWKSGASFVALANVAVFDRARKPFL